MLIWDVEASSVARIVQNNGIDRKVDWSVNGKWLVMSFDDGDLGVTEVRNKAPLEVQEVKRIAAERITINDNAELRDIKVDNGPTATFSAAGQLLSHNAAELDDHLLYLIEQEDGSLKMLKPTEFAELVAVGTGVGDGSP